MNIYRNKLLIIANLSEKKYQKGIKQGIKKLNDNGFKCLLLDDDYRKLYNKENQEKVNLKELDYVCSLGGDGSLLYAGKYAIKYDKPLFGINYGHVGYLCAFDKNDIGVINPELLSNKKISKESLLECVYHRKCFYSINDVIVGKDNFGETISLKATLNSENLCEFRGDGLIVSTKLGSSAYNKSCGSPVLKNKGKFIVTAICPSNTSFKNKIVNDDSIIMISLNNRRSKAGIYLDGKRIGNLENKIIIHKANKELKIVL